MTTDLLDPTLPAVEAPRDATAPADDRDAIVVARNITKRFKQYPTPAGRLAEWLSLGTLKRHTLFTALEEISFTIRRGEFFGIIGPNGSGKSTLLKILTGVLMPTAGRFSLSGRVMSLLE